MIIRACCFCGETKGTEPLTKEEAAMGQRITGKAVADGCPAHKKSIGVILLEASKLLGKFETKKKAPSAPAAGSNSAPQGQAPKAPAPQGQAPKAPAPPPNVAPQANAKTAAAAALPKVPPAKKTPEEIAAAVAAAHARNAEASAPQGGGAPAESFREEGVAEDAAPEGASETGA